MLKGKGGVSGIEKGSGDKVRSLLGANEKLSKSAASVSGCTSHQRRWPLLRLPVSYQWIEEFAAPPKPSPFGAPYFIG